MDYLFFLTLLRKKVSIDRVYSPFKSWITLLAYLAYIKAT
jgi:hypothetical protein